VFQFDLGQIGTLTPSPCSTTLTPVPLCPTGSLTATMFATRKRSEPLSETSRDYLDTSEKLALFIEEASAASVLAVDTEFIRERTFFPQLCLLQLATPERSVIVDPLALEDISPLKGLFLSPDIVKVFHAGEQDLELIYHYLTLIPEPLFDIQLAAELLGMPQQASLRTLVREFAGVRLSKALSFSEWNYRPLTDTQIEYALDDVRYLPRIYQKMYDQLEQLGRLEWLEEDFAALADVDRYCSHPDLSWRKIKHSSSLSHAQLGVLKEVAVTRDLIASKRNLPRKWIVTDELLIEIARLSPTNTRDLFHLRGAESQLGHHWSGEILDAVERGLNLTPEQLPKRGHPSFRIATNPAANDLLRALINQRARDNQVTPSMLVNKDELAGLASGEREGLRILTGWRYKLVGAELLELLDGNLTMRLEGNSIEVKHNGG
ncbi:MAG: ribonuclease D, partial [Coriobacteriia bacterium]|nr:ribonuclease D [Coriobacteriia bacterium]